MRRAAIAGLIATACAGLSPELPPPPPPELEADEAPPPAEPAENQGPTAAAFEASKRSPQQVGAAIAFRIEASDPDGDALSYLFWLKGPSTANQWQVAREWSDDEAWTWDTTGNTPGSYSVTVWIRDGRHAPDTGADAMRQVSFELAVGPACTLTGTAGARLRMGSSGDIEARRERLIRYIWSGAGFPSRRMPDRVDDLAGTWGGLTGVAKMKRLVVRMKHSVSSNARYLEPAVRNGHLFIYHEGHDAHFLEGKETIRWLLARGYAVVAMDMPLMGQNNRPRVTLPGGRALTLDRHDALVALEAPDFAPISYFLEPVAAVVSWGLAEGYTSVSVIGLSGGAWTATVYAAIDPRVERIYPVAGSVPDHLADPENPGDYEQTHAGLHAIANALELYLMASAGPGRRHFQILNRFDACCFAADPIEPEIIAYRDAVASKLACASSGGAYDVAIDGTHMLHMISPFALDLVGRDLPELSSAVR